MVFPEGKSWVNQRKISLTKRRLILTIEPKRSAVNYYSLHIGP